MTVCHKALCNKQVQTVYCRSSPRLRLPLYRTSSHPQLPLLQLFQQMPALLKLPFETFSEIAAVASSEGFVEDANAPLYSLSQVSSQTRRWTEDAAKLWCHISNRLHPDLLQKHIRLSKNLPLDVEIWEEGGMAGVRWRVAATKTLVEQSGRWSKLTVLPAEGNAEGVQVLEPHPLAKAPGGLHLPRLTVLNLWGPRGSPLGYFMPSLKDVTIRNEPARIAGLYILGHYNLVRCTLQWLGGGASLTRRTEGWRSWSNNLMGALTHLESARNL